MNRKTSIENIAMILALATIISKILGLMRELVVAYRFGAGSITDAFVLTNGIPSMIFVSIGTAININYIPYYQKLKDKEEQNQFTSNLLNIIIVILLVGCLFVNIFPKFVLNIFAVGLPDETKHYYSNYCGTFVSGIFTGKRTVYNYSIIWDCNECCYYYYYIFEY